MFCFEGRSPCYCLCTRYVLKAWGGWTKHITGSFKEVDSISWVRIAASQFKAIWSTWGAFHLPQLSRVALDRQASMRKILEIISKSKHLLLWGHACMMESTTQKNKGKKSSLLMRFKLVMGIDDSIIPKCNGSDPVLSYLAVAYNDGAVLPAMLSSLFGAAHALKTVISATTLVVFFFLPQWDSSLCWKKYTHLV